MKYWLTADTHFNHYKLLEYCGRPKDFEARIVRGFQVMKSSDIMIHLGDVCMGKELEMHEKHIVPIKAKKILIKGNHDGKSDHWYLHHGWDWVCRSMTLKRHAKKIMFSHRPQVWDGYWDINIHGHFHNCNHRRVEMEKDLLMGQHLLALEYNNYQMWNLDSILGDLNESKNKKN